MEVDEEANEGGADSFKEQGRLVPLCSPGDVLADETSTPLMVAK